MICENLLITQNCTNPIMQNSSYSKWWKEKLPKKTLGGFIDL